MIEKVLKSRQIEDLIQDFDNYSKECKEIAKQIHPDTCKDPRANEAFIHFMKLKEQYELGIVIETDFGKAYIRSDEVNFDYSDSDIGQNQILFKRIKTLMISRRQDNIKFYIPEDTITKGFKLSERLFPIQQLTLSEEHVRWIFSRMLEFSAYCQTIGICHAGINPDSVLINPETHGIKVIGFHHATEYCSKLKTVSGKYIHWYPKSVFDTKDAIPKIDIELSKRTACYLLGDKSGLGVKLKKTVSGPFMNFLLSNHSDAVEAFFEYKDMLKANYESKFYKLEL